MFGPLSFPSIKEKTRNIHVHEENDKIIPCLLCDKKYSSNKEKTAFLTHLLSYHSFVIRDIKKIASLSKYVEYWKERFMSDKPEDLGIKTIKHVDLINVIDPTLLNNESSFINNDASKYIFVLSDDLSEDRKLRNDLQTERLELVLDQQKEERDMTDYCRECLFCHEEVTGSTTDYLDHLSGKHNLMLGRPQNLVYVNQLIDCIKLKLDNLQCIYCEKTFKDRNTLKEHMRKKQHKRLNPKNTEYDRFYIVNYLEMGKNWKNLERIKERESPDSDGSDSDWSDWREEVQIQIVCLFCKNNSVSWEDTLNHMKSDHNFDYKLCTSNMDFYQQVKLVNYIRRQIHRSSCISCDFSISNDNISELLQHICVEHHFSLPEQSLWDQPEYFFPTYENDLFLCHIDDEACDSEIEMEPVQ